MEVTANVNAHTDTALVHWHDETAVPMMPIDQAPDDRKRVGLSRTILNHQGDFECPQCGTKVGTDQTTTVDIEFEGGDISVRYA